MVDQVKSSPGRPSPRRGSASLLRVSFLRYNAAVMHLALFAIQTRPRALEIAEVVLRWAATHGLRVRMPVGLAAALGRSEGGVPDDHVAVGAKLAIAVGGDGAMLAAVRACAPHGVPVLGVNAGALGFLTEVTPAELSEHLPRLLNEEYTLERRMMVHARVYRENVIVWEGSALNDVVIHQAGQGRLVHLDVVVSGHSLGHFSADGLIISTPTGSTAYGLAAGGPILHPTTSVLVLVPICPHSLAFRPIVVPATDPIQVHCDSNVHGDAMSVTADGQEPVPLRTGDRVVVHPATEPALLIKFGHFSFYDRLREKLQWGGG
jgi:NAD+ kinase